MRGRRRDAASDGGRGRCRTGLRRRPDLRRRVVHRRQRRDERRRQEGGAVGDGGRQPPVLADGDARRRVAGGHPRRSQPRQDSRRTRRHVRARVAWPGRQDANAVADADDSGRRIPQGRTREGRHRQVPRGSSRNPEGGMRRHHRQRALRAAPDAACGAHRMPRVLRPRARRHAGDRRDQEFRRRARRRRGRA